MEGYKDPFNRRPYPWGNENPELLRHFRCLGQLRAENAPLRLGDIAFFQAGEQKIGFTRSYQGQTLHIYLNRSQEPWEIPAGKVLLAYNLQTYAPNWIALAPMGFCITEEN